MAHVAPAANHPLGGAISRLEGPALVLHRNALQSGLHTSRSLGVVNKMCPEVLFRVARHLTAMQNRKTADGFLFSVLLSEDGEGRLELTKA